MALKLRQLVAAGLALLSPALSAPVDDTTADKGGGILANTYDYIVVGSGPGGAPLASNLARAGYSVLLLEAGDDQSASVFTQPLILGQPQPATRWDFYVRHYSDDALQLKNNHFTWKRADGSLWVGNSTAAPADATPLGLYYPRGATLGGSSIVNAGVSVLPPRSFWDSIGQLTGDSTWKCVLPLLPHSAQRLYILTRE